MFELLSATKTVGDEANDSKFDPKYGIHNTRGTAGELNDMAMTEQ